MDREEAIEELKEINFNSIHEKTIMATNMAIQALEQQPCDDAISRSEAIRIASGYCHWTNIPDELAKLPSVTPKHCPVEGVEMMDDLISRKAAIDTYKKLRLPIYPLEELPSVTPKHCEDAISRQAAIDAIYACYVGGKEAVDKAPMNDLYAEGIDEAVNAIYELPSVSTEKTGRWEWVQYDFDPRIGNWHCSECRNIIYCGVEKKGLHETVIYKYCPWCGAKMQEETETCKDCLNKCIMYEPNMKGCKDKMEGVEA